MLNYKWGDFILYRNRAVVEVFQFRDKVIILKFSYLPLVLYNYIYIYIYYVGDFRLY